MNIIERARELTALVKKINDVELYRKIVELQGEVIELSSSKLELDKKCTALEAELALKKNLRHERFLYSHDGDPVPYCPRCWEMKKQLIHLFKPNTLNLRVDPNQESWQCHTCHYDYFAQKGADFHAHLNLPRSRGQI